MASLREYMDTKPTLEGKGRVAARRTSAQQPSPQHAEGLVTGQEARDQQDRPAATGARVGAAEAGIAQERGELQARPAFAPQSAGGTSQVHHAFSQQSYLKLSKAP